tara:strand:- start:1222 stop:1521 length:300 start_codon:yes stop_codon:yes gene_type:complete
MIIKMKPTPLFSETANKLLERLAGDVPSDRVGVEGLFNKYIQQIQNEPGEIQLQAEIPRLQDAFTAGFEAGSRQTITEPAEPVLKDIKQRTQTPGKENE